MTTSAHPIQPAAVRLAINGMRCAEKVVFGDLGISADLPPDKPHDVTLPSLQPGVYEFTCLMGMYRGKIVAR